jgi:hypothetical protein
MSAGLLDKKEVATTFGMVDLQSCEVLKTKYLQGVNKCVLKRYENRVYLIVLGPARYGL